MKVDVIQLPNELRERMAATEQNPRYHGEGNVWAHTELVMQRFQELKDEFELDPSEEKVFHWAVLLHDVGKIHTTRFESGRWRSPGHEQASVPLARDILAQQTDLSPAERRQILSLVRWHGIPLKWSLNKGPIEQLKALGTQTNLRQLAIFSLFDLYGRECEEETIVRGVAREFLDTTAPRVEYELGRYDQLQERYANWNLRHKNAAWKALQLNDFRLLERLLEADSISEYQNRGQKVTLTVGPPKSGKSAYIEEQLPDLFHVRLIDHGFDEELAQEPYYLARKLVEFKHLLTVYLNRHQHVVLEGWNVDATVRRQIAAMVRDQEIGLEYLVFEAPQEELFERNEASESPLEEAIIRRAYTQWDLLHPWEAHRIHYAGEV